MKSRSEIWKVILLLMLVNACNVTRKMPPPQSAFDTQGHRGSRGLMPENTIPAMLKALDIGVTTLEMDVMITKDQQVILSHDPYFNHVITTKADGTFIDAKDERKYSLYAMTFAETQQFDVGMKGNPAFPRQEKIPVHKPLLRDAIDSIENHARKTNRRLPFYNIETKSNPSTDNILHPAPEQFVDLLMGVINQKNIAERVIIQSFDFRTLKVMHQKYPLVKTAALISNLNKKTVEAHLEELGFIPAIYSPEASLVNEELVRTCHLKKMKIIPWTVNNKAKIESLRSMGVDGIISDYPDLF